ncbi:uncharacterized protein ACLA_029500 [Aspergillus clavatus NRRL 1]|uniref:Uncharacterized protein n=1 Tax=Aspergillus clavatus (strain ATCC 1007 / CBS 513.65 / DSM 816 / NCTC 3887 / NRRL 1 / QM 1276 / 107) TaxID=344612 RepID=A1CRF1_ASPCL|nr:uncharacterized protein ACLA_029500 [Aspergillus clavatus NRRL 1]EAW08222.1 conserved hypothetical protein [Aspergillus clavatus NRRL 1]
MEVFPLSPDLEHEDPFESSTGSIDEASDYDVHSLFDEKIREITAAERQMIAELTDDFARGFDPDALAREIMAVLPLLADDLFPGSYAHLLIMLLETRGKMETTQVNLTLWMRARYPTAISEPNITSITDETFFVTEIEMLRRLLSTLRGDDCKPIYWITSRPLEIGRSCEHLEASIKVLRAFEHDIWEAIQEEDEDKTIYSDTPVSTERTILTSVRAQRYDCCRATLAWNDYLRTELALTVFYQFYRKHLMETNPERAREIGWLPPLNIEVPRSTVTGRDFVDLTEWPLDSHERMVLRLMFKVAQWLGLARGLPAVHLFCDIARYFTIHEPSKTPSASYIFFMQNLTEIRLCDTSIKSQIPSPFPYRDKQFADRNRDYYIDLFKSANDLVSCLVEQTSFLEKKSGGPSVVSSDGQPQRPVNKEIQMVREFPEIRGSLVGAWQDVATASLLI